MGRKKKDGHRICYYLANDVYEELTEYAEKWVKPIPWRLKEF